MRSLAPYLLPAAGFLLGCFLTWLIYRANERAAVARLDERLAAAKEAKDTATEQLALLQRELDSARANESRLLRQQGQLEGQIRAEKRLLEDMGLDTSLKVTPTYPSAGNSASDTSASTVASDENDSFVPEPDGESTKVQGVFGDPKKTGFAAIETAAPAEKKEPQTLEEYLAQDSVPVEDFEGYEGKTAAPDVKGAAAELRSALERRRP